MPRRPPAPASRVEGRLSGSRSSLPHWLYRRPGEGRRAPWPTRTPPPRRSLDWEPVLWGLELWSPEATLSQRQTQAGCPRAAGFSSRRSSLPPSVSAGGGFAGFTGPAAARSLGRPGQAGQAGTAASPHLVPGGLAITQDLLQVVLQLWMLPVPPLRRLLQQLFGQQAGGVALLAREAQLPAHVLVLGRHLRVQCLMQPRVLLGQPGARGAPPAAAPQPLGPAAAPPPPARPALAPCRRALSSRSSSCTWRRAASQGALWPPASARATGGLPASTSYCRRSTSRWTRAAAGPGRRC